jgi:hypothetical protein
MAPPVPEVDPENEEFVLFIRAKSGASGPTAGSWLPLSVMKGGSSANVLVRTMQSEWGRRLYSRTLVSNIAQGLYKERDSVVRSVRKGMPGLENVAAKDFEFAFKIRDKSNPKDWAKPDRLTVLPAEDELADNPLDRFRRFFSPESFASMFGA